MKNTYSKKCTCLTDLLVILRIQRLPVLIYININIKEIFYFFMWTKYREYKTRGFYSREKEERKSYPRIPLASAPLPEYLILSADCKATGITYRTRVINGTPEYLWNENNELIQENNRQLLLQAVYTFRQKDCLYIKLYCSSREVIQDLLCNVSVLPSSCEIYHYRRLPKPQIDKN